MKLCFLLIASYYIVMMFGCVYCTRELKLDFEFQFFNIANTIAFPRKHVRWNHVLSFNFGFFAIISLALRQKMMTIEIAEYLWNNCIRYHVLNMFTTQEIRFELHILRMRCAG